MRTRRSSLIKARDPLLERSERLVQAREVGGKPVELTTAHQRTPLVDGEIRRRLGEPARRGSRPIEQRTHAERDAMRSDIADEARKLLLHVPAQVAAEIAEFLGELALAADAGRRDHRGGFRPAGLQPPVRGDAEPHHRREGQAQLDALPGEKRKAIARPALAAEERVQHKAKGHRRGGLSRERAIAQCICWMPARSQPLEPSAGLTRFHTSSKPTGCVPGVSRTVPEKRTLAQYWSFSLATSSRSAFSATTSVCCTPSGVSRRSSS